MSGCWFVIDGKRDREEGFEFNIRISADANSMENFDWKILANMKIQFSRPEGGETPGHYDLYSSMHILIHSCTFLPVGHVYIDWAVVMTLFIPPTTQA